MLLILKFSFHYFVNIKNYLILFSILKMLIFKKSLFIFINTFFIILFFKLSLHFVFKKSLIFLINVIIFSLFINTFIIIVIVFSIKYDMHNNFDFLIISINFLYLKYQLDEFLFDLYIRYSSL